jgi:hypothetical protein
MLSSSFHYLINIIQIYAYRGRVAHKEGKVGSPVAEVLAVGQAFDTILFWALRALFLLSPARETNEARGKLLSCRSVTTFQEIISGTPTIMASAPTTPPPLLSRKCMTSGFEEQKKQN